MLTDLSEFFTLKKSEILDKLKFTVDNYSVVKIKINSYMIRTDSSKDEKRGLSIGPSRQLCFCSATGPPTRPART